VLVQRETESGRSPLASIAPFSEGQFEPPNVGYRKGQWVETALGGPIHHKVSCARVVDWVSWLIGSAQIQLATKRISKVTLGPVFETGVPGYQAGDLRAVAR